MVDGTENHERNLLVLENDHAAVSSKVEAVKEICRFDTLRSIKNDGDLLTRFLSAVIKFLETYPSECSKAVLDVLESAISDIVKLRDTFPLTSHLLNIICAVVRTGELELLASSNADREATERKSEDKFSAGKDGLPDKLVRLMKCLNLCDKSVMWENLGSAPNFAKYISVILKCMNVRGSSESVVTDLRQQTLRTVFRIFSNVKYSSVKPVSNDTLNEWVEILLSLVFDNNNDIQKSAVHALHLMWACLAASGWTKEFICSPELKKQIKSDYCPKLIKLVESPERGEPTWEVMWCLLVDLLANQLLSNQNSQLTNSMLAVEERAFKRSDRAPAFKCWKYLIEKLCASNGQDIKKHLKLLLQPLVISNTKNEQLIRLKHEVFWFFVCCVAPLCDDCSVVLNAFLRFNFGIPDQTDLSHFNLSVSNSSVTGNGKHAFSGLKRNFHIFRSGCIDRLAQVLCPTAPESKSDFEFESPKLSVAVIKSPAQFLRLHPLIIYCACSAVLIVAYRKNKEAQEVLNVVWESLVYHIKSLVTSEHSQKTKVTEVVRDFLCFLRSMSRQCIDDSFSSLLLSPVFENVICGRNCFPPAFLSSRLWHMKMADDMLPTPAAVLVECLLTPAVVPQDDQSNKFQKMMEVLIECGFSSDCPLDLALGIMRRLEICSYECDETKALTVYFTWYSLARKLETVIDKFLEVDPDLRNKLLEMVLVFPITRGDYIRLAADKLTDEKQKPFDVWRTILSSAVTHCTEEDKLNNKMCVHLCSKLVVYLKKDLNQQQCLYISKYICVLGKIVPWKDVTSHLVYSLDDIDCHMELLDEPCEQMSGIIDVILSLYNHVIKYEDNSAEKCSESLINMGICLTTVCEAILNEVVFLSFVIKLKHVIAFLMLNFCNRSDEVLEHSFICCWMKITHTIERHWGHINSESLTAAVITMLKAVAEHGSLEILRYTLKFWIGLPPKCNDLTPNLKQEIENMFTEMNSSLQRKEEKLKCNKNKIGSNKKRVSFAEKSFVTTFSPESVDPTHLNELSEKISSVKIQENTNVAVCNKNVEPDVGEDTSSLLLPSSRKHSFPEGCVVVNETPTVADTVSQNESTADLIVSSDDTVGSAHGKNPFAKSFFSNRTRRSSMATVANVNITVPNKNIEPLCASDAIHVCKKDNNITLTENTRTEQEEKIMDISSNLIIQESNYKSVANNLSSECDFERENDLKNHENIGDHMEAESDINNSGSQCVGESIQHSKSRLSLRKSHEMPEDKQRKLSVKSLKSDNQLESNTSVQRIDSGLPMKAENDSITGKHHSINSGGNKNIDVKNSNTRENSHIETGVDILTTNTADAKPLSLFGQVCDRNVPNQQISPSVKSQPGKEVPAETISQSEDANLESLSDRNSQFAKPEEKGAVRRRKSLQATDFPVRHSPRRPLTKHQKECLKRKRDDIPALYCDLSEDSQSSTFSEMSQDDSQISIPERRSLSKPARPEEKQLSFAHLRRVSKPNSLSSLIQKTLEAPEEATKNEMNKGKPSSSAISPEAKIRKIDTNDVEHKSLAGHERKCQANVGSGHTVASEDGSVVTLKAGIEHVIEKKLEDDADGNNLSMIESNEIKATAVDSTNSVKDDKENSSSIKTVSTRTDDNEPDVSSSVRTTMSENSPNRRKSLRPLKRIIKNAGKNSGNNKVRHNRVGHINKWRTQNRRESLHPLKRLITNKGKNSKSSKFGLLKDKKNLTLGCGTVDKNTSNVSTNLGLPSLAVLETASVSEKKQLNCSTAEVAAVNSFKHTTPSPLKDLTQSKIDKYTLRSRISSEGNVPQAKKSVQYEHQQVKGDTSAGLSLSLVGNVEVSVEINQRDVQDAENLMRKSRVTEMVKSESSSKMEHCSDIKKITVNPEDEGSVQLQLASADKETNEKLILESVPIGKQDASKTEKSKSMKLRDRTKKSLSTKTETTAKDLCDVLSESAKHNVNANDKSSVSEEHLQNTDGIKTRKVKQRNVCETGKIVAECDNLVGRTRIKEKHVTEPVLTRDSDLSLSSKENIHRPFVEPQVLKTMSGPNDDCRTEIGASIISKGVSDLFPQAEEITKIFSNDTVQVVTRSGEEHEIKFTKDEEKAGCDVNKASGNLPESVDIQQLNNLKLVSGPYVHLTNIIAKSNVANNFNEHSKCAVVSKEGKSLQQSCLDSEDFVEDSQDLTSSSNKRTRKWTRRVSDGKNTRSNQELRSQQLISPENNEADALQLTKLTVTRANEEIGTATLGTLKNSSDSGCCKPVNENIVKQHKPIDGYDSSDACVEHSAAHITSVREANDKEKKTFHTPETVITNIKESNILALQDEHNIDRCKDAVEPVVPKEPEQVVNTVNSTVVPKIAREELHSSLNVQSVSTVTMRRSLRARRKSKTRGCLYSSCCRQVDTNKTRIAKRITARSLRLARQGQVQKAELSSDSGGLLPNMTNELQGQSDLQSARQKTMCAVRTESTLGHTRDSTYSKDHNEIEQPDTNTKAESGCLKRKSVSDEEAQKDDVSPKKQKKRVSFSDPDVSSTCYFEEYPIEELHKDYQWIARSGGMEDEKSEDHLVLDMEDLRDYSEDLEEDTSLLDSQSPIWPSLAGCTYPVEEVVKFVVAPTWAKNAVRYFEEQGIKTIGDISSMDEARISALPVREPKVAVVKRVLKVYEEKLNRIKAGATAAEVNLSRTRRKVQRIQRRGGLAAAIQKSSTKSVTDEVSTSKGSAVLSISVCNGSTSDDHHNSQKSEYKSCTLNVEGLQNKSSEMVFQPFGNTVCDSDGRLQHRSDEGDSVDVQKSLSGSGHNSLLQNTDKTKSSRQCANYTKDGTYLPGSTKSNNKISSPSSASDESVKNLPPTDQSVEKKMNDGTNVKGSTVNHTAVSEDIGTMNTEQILQKHVQEELVVVFSEDVSQRNLVKRAVGRTEQTQEKVVPADSFVEAKETNENSTKWQEDVLSQNELDSFLGDWNVLESGCMEIIENGNCKEDSDAESNDVTVSANLPQARTAAVFTSDSASGSSIERVTDHHTVSHDKKPKDTIDCSIPELKSVIEKHSIVNVTRELLRLWKYGERLRQDISVGNLLNRLENAEVTDLRQQTQSVAVQANSCLCDLHTINALKMIYEKISCSEEGKT